ncbi:calmodulin-dependent protein kinase [Gigaspora margarita]|uniref:Calmodulin-dependent protein kinase n=1 Tax=Gigaspora margarita TaxID=4874 RepID=A0A8H4EJK6_GIGMA|nr:calmodulin-dependent protein kinase [Gigaspora margarita]
MGDADGTSNLGYCYQNGIGIEKDEYKVYIYYKKFAEIGNIVRIYNVGYCYNKGIGIEKDKNKAFIYYQKSAKMGNTNGTYNIGYCYHYGVGVEKNKHNAFIYYQKSAEMSDADGACKVGHCYFYRVGVEKNDRKLSFIIKNLQRWVAPIEYTWLHIVIIMELKFERIKKRCLYITTNMWICIINKSLKNVYKL